jgi:hypothetical protein
MVTWSLALPVCISGVIHAGGLRVGPRPSPRLVTRLADVYPDSAHVRYFGLGSASDEAVWRHAAAQLFTV